MRLAADPLRLARDRQSLGAILTIAATLAAALGATVLATPPQKLDTKSLVARAASYVTAYQKEFASLVADEHYRQTFDDGQAQVQTRDLRGEMFLAYLEADRVWTAVHDFQRVDGVDVTGRIRVREVLTASRWQSVARQVATLNERYNIGTVRRNINEPTFALNIFAPPRIGNFKFGRAADDRLDPTRPLARLEFEERKESTLVRFDGRRPIPSKGTVTLDAESGAIFQTLIQFEYADIAAELTTTYGRDERLDLLVPTRFTEIYTRRAENGTETTTCESIYTNYRKFGATGRIK